MSHESEVSQASISPVLASGTESGPELVPSATSLQRFVRLLVPVKNHFGSLSAEELKVIWKAARDSVSVEDAIKRIQAHRRDLESKRDDSGLSR